MKKTLILGALLLGTAAAVGSCSSDEPAATESAYEEDDELYVFDDDDGRYYPYSHYTKPLKNKKLYKSSGGGYVPFTGTPHYNPGYGATGQRTYYGTTTPAPKPSSGGSQFGKSSTASSGSSFGFSGSSSSSGS